QPCATVLREGSRQRVNGGAAVEEHGIPVAQQPQTGTGDRLLRGAIGGLAPRELAVDVRMDRERPAVGSLEQPLLLERAEVLADRWLGDAEERRKLADPSATAHPDELCDARLPLICEGGTAGIGSIRHWPKRTARKLRLPSRRVREVPHMNGAARGSASKLPARTLVRESCLAPISVRLRLFLDSIDMLAIPGLTESDRRSGGTCA